MHAYSNAASGVHEEASRLGRCIDGVNGCENELLLQSGAANKIIVGLSMCVKSKDKIGPIEREC